MAVTQMEATSARYVFPCFDEPKYKANFSIKVGQEKGRQVMSNMPWLQRDSSFAYIYILLFELHFILLIAHVFILNSKN